MTDIPFTQYLLPDGRPAAVTIDRPEQIAAKAQAILATGLRFECEMLTTGMVSFTIADREEEEDVAIEVCPNGPEVPAAVDRLIETYYGDNQEMLEHQGSHCGCDGGL